MIKSSCRKQRAIRKARNAPTGDHHLRNRQNSVDLGPECVTPLWRVRGESIITLVRHIFAYICAVCAILFFGIAASAETYSDNMDSAVPDSVKSYYNLKKSEAPAAWKSLLPDNSFLVFTNSEQPTAKAVYTVQSAKEVSVEIYTHTGSFTSWSDDYGMHILGFYRTGVLTDRPAGYSRALYSPSRKSVYRGSGANFQSLLFESFYQFADSTESAPGDLVDYAVNVYCSSDGQSYRKINLTPGAIWFSAAANYCNERFTGSVPAGTKMIMVEINDFNKYYDSSNNSTLSKLERLMTSLASVSITGDKLILGPEKTEPSVSSSSSQSIPESSSQSSSKSNLISSSNSSSSVKSSSSTKSSSSSKKTALIDDEAVSKTTSSAKFEGVIVASEKSDTGQSSSKVSSVRPESSARSSDNSKQAQSSAQSQSPATTSSVPEQQDAESGNSPVILAVQPQTHKAPETNRDDSLFTWAVTGYIILVSGAILFFALRPKK